MIIYVDITQLEKGRANTGIQRVVKEFLKRAATSENITLKIIIFQDDKSVLLLQNHEVSSFLENMQFYQFKSKEPFNLLEFTPTKTTAFFDIDASWNIVYRRESLYPVLKENGFLIFNFIYDMIPLLFPEYAHEVTAQNFQSFIDASYQYSDLVFFDSLSAQNDYIRLKNERNFTREIATRTVGLGSNFLKVIPEHQEEKIEKLLHKKYILFVGTIEPRKKQAKVLEAFEELAQKYPDLNLVIIGRQGWKVEAFIEKITNHKLLNKQLFWLNNIDDNTLNQFYQNAFLITYISEYEGYGLPIAESLSHGKITITSRNSSMYEVGRDFADYVVFDSHNELTSLISLYYEHRTLYTAKINYIKNNFKTTSWDQFYTSIEDVAINYEKALSFKENHLNSLQFVFISIDKQNLIGTIKAIDKYIDFVKEYIIITQASLLDEFSSIKSSNKITLINEKDILNEYCGGFSKRDHVSKNWLLRTSLLNLDILEDEFIMLDDDNRPLKEISINKFISSSNSYNAYYFYALLDWNYTGTEYDAGQQNMQDVLTKENYELYSYSVHAPQIINKKILQEVVDKFFDIGLKKPIDEWSMYFNYAISVYPSLFNKKPFETLNWPANPTDWDMQVVPKEYSFENYYKTLYENGTFKESDTYEMKIIKKTNILTPYIESKEMVNESKKIFSLNNMVHKVMKFKQKNIEFYITNIPQFIILKENSDFKLRVNYKLLNPNHKNLDIAILIYLNDKLRTTVNLEEVNSLEYKEALIELPIVTTGLKTKEYSISFNLEINKKNVYKKRSSYATKLIVTEDKTATKILQRPEYQPKIVMPNTTKTLKEKIKSIPLLGWFLRWTNNLLRLNNIKHTLYMQGQEISRMQAIINKQQHNLSTLNIQAQQQHRHNEKLTEHIAFLIKEQKEEIDSLLEKQTDYATQTDKKNLLNKIEHQEKQLQNKITAVSDETKKLEDSLNSVDDNIKNLVAKEITFQSDSFEQRIDQFLFDAKIETKLQK